jgi:hypothetical protein
MTNKVVLRTIDQFMADYVPVYQPIYPLFLNAKSQGYSEDVGTIDFKRLEAVGDIRAKRITPKDTEIRQISVKESSKTFKKYFFANQFVQSALQDQSRTEDVVAQVLDEHQKHQDDLFLLGEGTSDSTMINNGLFWSNDPNYTLETSDEVDTDLDPLIDLHARVMVTVNQANQLAGRKVIMFYGTEILALLDSVYAATSMPFKKVLKDVLDENVSVLKMPSAVTPSSTNGWIVANLDQVKLHYMTGALPSLKAQGVNDEKMYSWFNFLMGSMMLEVLAQDGIIRQPVTIES